MSNMIRSDALQRVEQLIADITARQSLEEPLRAVRQRLGTNPLAPSIPGDEELLATLTAQDHELESSIEQGIILVERLANAFGIAYDLYELNQHSVHRLAVRVTAYLKEGSPEDEFTLLRTPASPDTDRDRRHEVGYRSGRTLT